MSWRVITLLVSIILLSGILRIYSLSSNPPSLDWDEASLGYNAFSLLRTGRDEYGIFLPSTLKSFGDYKPPAYTYLTIPFVATLGLNEYSVRLPSALGGIIAVFGTFFLIREGFRVGDNTKDARRLALLGTLFLALSPWHLQFSRAAFEANLGLSFTILGILCFLKATSKGWWLFVSAPLLIASLYSYHSSRLITPLLIVGCGFYFRQQLVAAKKVVVTSIILSIVLLSPVFASFFSGNDLSARFKAVGGITAEDQLREVYQEKQRDRENGRFLLSLFHDSRIVSLINVIGGYVDHFQPNFLFLKGDAYFRHNAHRFGLLYPIEIILVPIGVLYLLRSESSKFRFVIFWWFIVAPLASALTKGTPHAIRSLLYLPTFQIFSAFGTYSIWNKFRSTKFFPVGLITVFLYAFNIFYYLNVYHKHTPVEISQSWQYGYKQVVDFLRDREKEVDKIVFTNKYDQPYIFVLFYTPIDPSKYQQLWQGQEPSQTLRAFGKYEFRKVDWDRDDYLRNIIIVGSAGDPPEIPPTTPNIVREVRFLNGEVAFRIVQR